MFLMTFMIGALISFATGYVVALWRLRTTTPEVVRPLEAWGTRGAEPERLTFEALAASGSQQWREEMESVGERMRSAGVRLVLFSHGSFVGDDPLSVARALEEVPALADVARGLREFTRAQLSRALGDLSSFSNEYAQAFATATGIDATSFVWSGENHHVGRVQGAVRLSRALALHGGGALRSGDRILLMGHSHAGQIFAVLSQLIARTQGYDDLVEAARARGEEVEALEDDLALLRRLAVDVVTFGTPPRYACAERAKFRLLHVVNHRGSASSGMSLRGLFHTLRGDYVHQLGAAGSDWPAPTAKERNINKRLDRVLGVGSNLRAWVHQAAHALRVSPQGHTVLVDYGDAAAKLPNFWATGFGHSAYTRREAMLFHARLVASHFYPARAHALWGERAWGWVSPRSLLMRRNR